jgi:DNA-binding NarL/FixJ family response regulator
LNYPNTKRINVAVESTDPVSLAGIATQLRGRPSLTVVDDLDLPIDVVVAAISVDKEGLQTLRCLSRTITSHVVALVGDVDDAAVLRLVEAGATAVIRRDESTPERLEEAIGRAAQGQGCLPPDMLGGLLKQVKGLQQNVLTPQGLNLSGLSGREISVLSLVADGLDTRSIAAELCYSERTIKNILQDIMRRFGLRNRSHAVAFALRQGLI